MLSRSSGQNISSLTPALSIFLGQVAGLSWTNQAPEWVNVRYVGWFKTPWWPAAGESGSSVKYPFPYFVHACFQKKSASKKLNFRLVFFLGWFMLTRLQGHPRKSSIFVGLSIDKLSSYWGTPGGVPPWKPYIENIYQQPTRSASKAAWKAAGEVKLRDITPLRELPSVASGLYPQKWHLWWKPNHHIPNSLPHSCHVYPIDLVLLYEVLPLFEVLWKRLFGIWNASRWDPKMNSSYK